MVTVACNQLFVFPIGWGCYSVASMLRGPNGTYRFFLIRLFHNSVFRINNNLPIESIHSYNAQMRYCRVTSKELSTKNVSEETIGWRVNLTSPEFERSSFLRYPTFWKILKILGFLWMSDMPVTILLSLCALILGPISEFCSPFISHYPSRVSDFVPCSSLVTPS